MTKLSEYYSKQLFKYTPCGAQTLSKMACRYPGNYPTALEFGKDGHVWDVEGQEYIDLISGLGAISVGYAHEAINRAAFRQMQKGVSFSLPTAIEFQAAKKLTELVTGTEMWKFGKNGTDGTVMAVRAARAFTGRMKIMTVGYNGCADQFEIKGVRTAGIPKELESTIVKATYNDLNSFDELRQRNFACVLLEPMVCEYPKSDFLYKLRQLCDINGTLLIFDEVVNGGRFEGFTSASYFKAKPDLYVLSKGIANGFPLCAVGGARSIMATFEREDFFASGTFGGETVSLAAFLETQRVLTESFPHTLSSGSDIKDAFNFYFNGYATAEGYPTRLVFKFPTEDHKYLFWQEMCKQGILVGYTNFVMSSHTDKDVDKINTAFCTVSSILKANWSNPKALLIGDLPCPALRKS